MAFEDRRIYAMTAHWYSLSNASEAPPAVARDRPRNRMFKWLAKQFSQDDEDPDSLGSEKGLQAFIAALPISLPTRTVEAIGEPFENVRGLHLPGEKLCRALKRLDERAQAPLIEVGLALFEDFHGRRIADSPWLTLARYYRNVHTGYRIALGSLTSGQSIADEQRSDAILLGCRAIAALGRHKALMRLRYRDVDPGYWENLNGLATWAEQLGATATLMELYPGSGYQTNIEREYLVALMFDAAPIANMLPTQMAGLDLILRRFAGNFQFSGTYRDATPFAIDPLRNQPPQRWLRGLPPRAGLRFFGTGTAYAQIAGLLKQAGTHYEVPDWLAPARLDPELYRGLLELLATHWSTEPPQRRYRRDRGEGEVLVTHGVAQVRRMIAASEFAKAGGQLGYQENTPYDHKLFDTVRFGVAEGLQPKHAEKALPISPMEVLQKFELEGDRQMTERWNIADLSEGGMGVVAPAHGGWARVGMLIGLRRMDSLDWQLAVVRRLSRSGQGKLSIGMQWVPGSTWCGRLRFGDGKDAGNPWVAVAGSSEIFHDAILLRAAGLDTLLIEPGIFLEPGECMLSYEKRWRKVEMLEVLERGYDYERIRISLSNTK